MESHQTSLAPRDRAGIACDASWDFGAPARQRLRSCLVRLRKMPSTTLLRIFRLFQSRGGDEGYRVAFEKLEEEAANPMPMIHSARPSSPRFCSMATKLL